MKIPAVLLLVSFGFIYLSSMTHVEGRGLKETSRFTGRSNNEEREHPLSHNDMKVGTGQTVTVEREKDVVKPKTSYGGKHARNEINCSLSNNEYSEEDADDTSGGDDGTGQTVTVEREKDVVKPKTSYGGKHARNEINSSLSNNEYSEEDADDTSGGDDGGDDGYISCRTNSHHRPPTTPDCRRVACPRTKIP